MIFLEEMIHKTEPSGT